MSDISASVSKSIPHLPNTFLAIPQEDATLNKSRVVVLPVPYDSTASYRAGMREGPGAIINASRQLEDFDLELGFEPMSVGIHTAPELEPHMDGPKAMVQRIKDAVTPLAKAGKLVAVLGGEHTVALGSIQAFASLYDDLSVLYLDAHADMRDEYMGTRHGHASVARRAHELCPVVEVGVRSLSQDEHRFIQKANVPVFYWSAEASIDDVIPEVLSRLSPKVYISVDVDVFDPSVMSAVSLPEAGGMAWYEVLKLLRAVSEKKEIVGFDINELSPQEGPDACAFTAAKLAYKIIGYTVAAKEIRPSKKRRSAPR